MPFVEAILRGQKVFARVDDSGHYVNDGGRVEIRYKPNDGRAYRASVANLERVPGGRTLADDALGHANQAPDRSDTSGRPARAPMAAPAQEPSDPAAVKGARFVAYTDGACSGNPGPAGAGFIVVAPDGKIHEGFAFLGSATNNVAELTALLLAIEAIPANAASVILYTDSQYAIGVLQKGWKAKANQELVARIKSAFSGRRDIRLVYVPGHAGVPLNERADELARDAIRTRSSQRVSLS